MKAIYRNIIIYITTLFNILAIFYLIYSFYSINTYQKNSLLVNNLVTNWHLFMYHFDSVIINDLRNKQIIDNWNNSYEDFQKLVHRAIHSRELKKTGKLTRSILNDTANLWINIKTEIIDITGIRLNQLSESAVFDDLSGTMLDIYGKIHWFTQYNPEKTMQIRKLRKIIEDWEIFTVSSNVFYSKLIELTKIVDYEIKIRTLTTAVTSILSVTLATVFTLYVYIYFNRNLNLLVKKRTGQLERAKEEIERVVKEKTNFFVNLAHETKTPLTIISNYLDKYINKIKNNIPYELNLILNNINKLKRDMINFLDVEKLERGQIFYNHNLIIDMSGILKEKIILFHELAHNRGITINSEIEKNIRLKIDPSAIERIINNLMINSIKYNKTGGTINVFLKTRNDKACFIVNDTGIGMTNEQKQNIFQPYRQISQQKRNIQGIGMGLTIVNKIVNEIDAEISVDSELNKGTTFTILFKKHILAVTEKIVNAKFESGLLNFGEVEKTVELKLNQISFDNNKNTILIVEDNKAMLYYLYENLKQIYNVFFACDGEQAMAKLTEVSGVDLILSDIMMSGMDGMEFLNKIQEIEPYNIIPLIFLTAKTNMREKICALNSGAVDYISKPFNINELKAKINVLLKNRKNQKDFDKDQIVSKISNLLKQESTGNFRCIDLEKKYNLYDLNYKERKIIDMLIKGNVYKEISFELNIPINTLKSRISKIYKTVKVQNKIELINKFKN